MICGMKLHFCFDCTMILLCFIAFDFLPAGTNEYENEFLFPSSRFLLHICRSIRFPPNDRDDDGTLLSVAFRCDTYIYTYIHVLFSFVDDLEIPTMIMIILMMPPAKNKQTNKPDSIRTNDISNASRRGTITEMNRFNYLQSKKSADVLQKPLRRHILLVVAGFRVSYMHTYIHTYIRILFGCRR